MWLLDDLPKLAVFTFIIALIFLALWGRLDRRSTAAALIRRVWAGRGRRVVLIVFALLVFWVVAEDVLEEEDDEWLRQLDRWALAQIGEIAPAWRGPATVVSRLTGEGLVLPIAAALVWLVVARRYRTAGTVVAGTLAAWAISGGLKLAFGVPRPRDFEALRLSMSYGFPSGHALVTFVTAGLIIWALNDGKNRSACTTLRVCPWIVAGLAGTARMLLHAHWLSDVLAGLAIGVVFLQLVLIFAPDRPNPSLRASS